MASPKVKSQQLWLRWLVDSRVGKQEVGLFCFHPQGEETSRWWVGGPDKSSHESSGQKKTDDANLSFSLSPVARDLCALIALASPSLSSPFLNLFEKKWGRVWVGHSPGLGWQGMAGWAEKGPGARVALR